MKPAQMLVKLSSFADVLSTKLQLSDLVVSLIFIEFINFLQLIIILRKNITNAGKCKSSTRENFANKSNQAHKKYF